MFRCTAKNDAGAARLSSALLACGLTVAAGSALAARAPQRPAMAAKATAAAATAATTPTDDGANWLGYGRTPDEQRYSPLAQITTRNVAKLGLDWSLDLPDATSLTSTPLAVDGVLYFSGDRAIVRAVDARTGKLLWTYDPQAWKHAPRGLAMGWNTNRGIAWEDGRVFVGATDGRLVALDAKSGTVLWAARSFPVGANKAITGPPRVSHGRVFIGHGGADYGTRGYLDAFDAKTGERLWRFYTVPGDPSEPFENAAMEKAAQTWKGDWWKLGGGGTVWHAITVDPELDLVYLGVGNGSPWDYERRSRSQGDNLYLCSIVALRASTGEYVWHYQLNPGEEWDYKAAADIVLADLVIGGVKRKVLMQAPTNGFYYVLDRSNGQLLSAQPYEKVTWAERIDLATGRPVEAPHMRLANTERVEIWPGPWGGHNWQAMSFNPALGLAYIPTMHMPGTFAKIPGWQQRQHFFAIGKDVGGEMDASKTYGGLLAWDPVAQRERWRVKLDAVWNGGTLATAGRLVFHGTGDGRFTAYDGADGQVLWGFDAQRGITGAPISYAIDGRQHVAVLVGWGGLASFGLPAFHKHGWKYRGPGIRVLSFSLDGRATLPAVPDTRFALAPVDTGSAPIDEQSAAAGFALYHTSSCATCHGAGAVSNGAAGPDLRESALANDYAGFRAVVAEGALLANGMPMFDDFSERELRAVYDYVRQQTRAAAGLARPARAARQPVAPLR